MAAGLLRFLRRAIRTKGAVVHLLCASGNVEESGGQHSHSSWPAASDGIPVEPTKGRRHHVVGNGRKIDLAGVHLLSTISKLRDLIYRPLARHGHLRASVVGRLTCNRGKIRKRAGGEPQSRGTVGPGTNTRDTVLDSFRKTSRRAIVGEYCSVRSCTPQARRLAAWRERRGGRTLNDAGE